MNKPQVGFSFFVRSATQALGVALLIILSGRLGQILAAESMPAIWPQSGIALAALVLVGNRLWLGVLMGSFLVFYWGLQTFSSLGSRTPPELAAIAFALGGGATLQALFAAWLFRRFIKTASEAPPCRVNNVLRFIGIAAIAAIIGPSIEGAVLGAVKSYDWSQMHVIWRTCWLDEFTGIIVIAPLAITWSHGTPFDRHQRLIEAFLLGALTMALSFTVFWGEILPGLGRHFPLTYGFLPFLIWAAFRLGLRGVTAIALLISIFAVSATANGFGPFVSHNLPESLFFLQIFICIITVTGLFLAAALEDRLRSEDQLRHANVFLDSVLENMPNMVFVKAAHTLRFVRLNRAGEALLGRSRLELMGKNDYDFFPKEEADFFTAMDRQVLAGEAVLEIPEEPIHTRAGEIRYLRTRKTTIRSPDGEALFLLGVSEDITELRMAQLALKTSEAALRKAHDELEERVQKRTEELATAVAGLQMEALERQRTESALRESEERLMSLIESSPDSISLKDAEGRWLIANTANLRTFDLVGVDYHGKRGADLAAHTPFYHAALDYCEKTDRLAMQGGDIVRCEEIVPQANGFPRFFDVIKVPIINPDGTLKGLVVIGRDITELKRDEERLKAALLEKEVLIKEIHHRVKNNLQIISSLLNLQSTSTSDSRAKAILQDSRDRVRSMAMLHEQLYQSGDLANIDFASYIRSLTANLLRAYRPGDAGISILIDVNQVRLDVNRAVPCALIINEVVINALKHAFPNNAKGEIRIQMRVNRAGLYRLHIADNGVGMPPDLANRSQHTLGLQLIEGLTRQLGGRLKQLRPRRGTAFELVFNHVRKTPAQARVAEEIAP